MPGSLSDILPQPLDEQSEEILNDLLKRKITSAAGLAVDLLHAMEERFGPEAREVVRDMAQRRRFPERANPGEAAVALRRFCDELDQACIGSHRWERTVDEPQRIGYLYTRCLWAEVFRKLGEPELGYIFCAGDEPAVRACHPQLGFRRTQTLMLGDPLCDHIFLVEGEDAESTA